jgi:alginate O-acetyltransferase complex protein AlgI
MTPIETMCEEAVKTERSFTWIGWTPIAILPLGVMACRELMPAWEFMWCLSFAIFGGLKWLTWWKAQRQFNHAFWRSVAYLAAWPGMDAEAFLSQDAPGKALNGRAWVWALLKTAVGAALIWLVARQAQDPLLQGWVGMFGLILLLHFGSFEVIALFWQRLGINARPIMSAPLRSTSLSEFWGSRWNLGFRQFAHDLIFSPLQKKLGAGAAGFLVFLASGLIHESVISVPARGGYGLPTTYFALQGLGVAAERSALGKRLGLRRGWRGWLFTAAFTAGPVFLLFHRPFVLRVIVPFLEAFHAL